MYDLHFKQPNYCMKFFLLLWRPSWKLILSQYMNDDKSPNNNLELLIFIGLSRTETGFDLVRLCFFSGTGS